MRKSTNCKICEASFKCNGDYQLFDWQIKHMRENHINEYEAMNKDIAELKKQKRLMECRHSYFTEESYFHYIMFS